MKERNQILTQTKFPDLVQRWRFSWCLAEIKYLCGTSFFMQTKLIHINNFEHGPALKREVKVDGSLKTENWCHKLTHKLNVM